MVRRHRQIVAALVLVVFGPTMAFGQAPLAGVVTTLEGSVTATRAAQPQPVPLKFKDEVFLRDKVVTGDRSLARLLLGGKAIVTVRERSALTITEIPGRSTVELESGKVGLAAARDKMRPGEVVDIRTPNAIVAVRGTVVVAEVTRASAQVSGAPPVVTTAFYLLRGTAEATRVDPATGSPIGAPLPLNVMTSFRVTGTATPIIAPIPPDQVTQITAGLIPSQPQHISPANEEQIKTQVVDATTAVLNTIISGGAPLVGPAVSPDIAQATDPTPPTPNPINGIDRGPASPFFDSGLTIQDLIGPEITISGNLTIPAGTTLKTFDATASRTATSALIQVSNPPLPYTADELQTIVETLSDSELVAFFQANNVLVNQLGADNLMEVKAGAVVTLASRLITTENAAVLAGNNFLRVDGTLTSTAPDGLMFFDPSAVASASDFLAVGPTGSLALAGPAIDALQSLVKAGGNLVAVTGGSIQAGARLLNFQATDIELANNLLRIADGGSVGGATADALVGLTGVSYIAGGPFGSASGGSLLRMFSQTGQPGTKLSLTGPYLVAVAGGFQFNDAPAFNIADGASITSASPLPFAQFADTVLNSANHVFNFDTATSFTPPGQPTTVGSGAPVRVSLAGPLADLTDTTVTTSNDRGFLRVNNDVQITQGGASALIGFNGVFAQSAGNMIVLTALPALPSPVLTLAGTLANFLNSVIAVGDPQTNVNAFFFVGDGSRVINQGAGPLLVLDGVTLDAAGPVVVVRRSKPGQPSQLTLAAPLLVATDSFIDTTSLGFGNTFGVASACCTSIVLEQGGVLTSSTPDPLIQLVRTFVNAGPDGQSGGNFIHVRDTGPNGTPAPATMALGGPLLSAQDSAITSLFHTLFVGRATLTSSTGAPLISAVNSAILAGGPDPLNGDAMTSARLFSQVASDAANTVAPFPSMVSLAGPLAALTATTVLTTSDLVGVFNGARFQSTTTAALIQLASANIISSTVDLAINGRLLTLANLGGVSGTEFATMVLNGGVLASTDGTMVMNGLIGVFPGAQLVVNGGGDAVALITGGNHDFGAVTGGTSVIAAPMFSLRGRSTALAADPDEPRLIVGTDQPIQTSRVLLDAVGTTIQARKVAQFVDQTLLNATVEALFRARGGSNITVAEDAIDLTNRARVATSAPVLALNFSSFTVATGSAIVVNNSHLKVDGDLFVVGNGSTLAVNLKGLPNTQGALVRVMNGGVLNVTGGVIRFEGPNDANTLRIFNTLCPGGDCNTLQGLRVGLLNNASISNVAITGTPIKGTTPNTVIDLNSNNAAHVILDGPTSKITIGGK